MYLINLKLMKLDAKPDDLIMIRFMLKKFKVKIEPLYVALYWDEL